MALFRRWTTPGNLQYLGEAMSISSPRQLTKLALVLVALWLVPNPALAGATAYEDCVVRAMQLLRDLFPNLSNNANVVISYGAPLGMRDPLYQRNSVDLSLYRPREHRAHVAPSSEYLFGAGFQFDRKDRRLKSLVIVGPYISDRVDRLAKEVDAHQEWSDAQVIAALKAAGAKLGPDDRAAFLNALPLKALEPLTGRLEITSVDFGVRFDPGSEGEPREADLSWMVKAKSRSGGGRHDVEYVMIFEPFEGVLEHLYTSPCLPRSGSSDNPNAKTSVIRVHTWGKPGQ